MANLDNVCLNCKRWSPKGEAVGMCAAYNELRFQHEGPIVERVNGSAMQFDCFDYEFMTFRAPYKERFLNQTALDLRRKEADAVYEKMRCEREKRRANEPYWMKIKRERKHLLAQEAG
jgi:hypothetical protein